MKHLTLVPAYGRDYETAARAEGAWLAGKDWRVPEGPYVGIGEASTLRERGYTSVRLRYAAKAKSIDVTL